MKKDAKPMPANRDKKMPVEFCICEVLTQQPPENNIFILYHLPFEQSKDEWGKNIEKREISRASNACKLVWKR